MGSDEKKSDAKVTKSTACLYVLATPIGNLADMSPRAKQIIEEADLILCEDTRQLRKLLAALDLKAKAWQAYHDHNEQNLAESLIRRMQNESLQVVLVSDSGTPCISDPGYRLTSLAHQQGLRVCPIPGPSAPIALLSASGLPSDKFYFCGFLPRKNQELIKTIEQWRKFECVIVFFESGKRLEVSLQCIQNIYPTARLSLGRELSKMHEDIRMLSIDEALLYAADGEKQRGEFVIAVDLNEVQVLDLAKLEDDIRKALDKGLSSRDILEQYQPLGYNKNQLYDLILRVKKTDY